MYPPMYSIHPYIVHLGTGQNRAPKYEHFLHSELRLKKCQSVQQNFAQMYDISKKFFILYNECLIFTSNLVKMYIQSN